MAEVTRRSFDLKSWQGLTLVLKVARESHLSPSAYAEFRNLVLEYAQQKGTDASLKAKIDAIIATFEEVDSSAKSKDTNDEKKTQHERLGRRVVPTFIARSKEERKVPVSELITQPKEAPLPPVEIPQARDPQEVPLPPTPPASVDIPKETPVPEIHRESTAPKSVDEHRARIMEIKRRVNSLIKNPIGLVDHGNHIGREYMVALLGALKATNPGATHDLEGAMAVLEESFTKILGHIAEPHQETSVREEPPVAEPVNVNTQDSSREEDIPAVVPPPESLTQPEPEPEPERTQESFSVAQEVTPLSPIPEEPVVDEAVLPEVEEAPDQAPTSPDEKRWSEEGGDADMKEQIQALREQLKSVEGAPKAIHGGKHSLIPSILEIEDGPGPQADITGSDWDPYVAKDRDELSPAALTERPTSSMTGITLDTPQSELMSPEITMALGKLLHEWKIFASSGLFGMGPGGIEHPLYVRLARLSMAEIITGRYEDADMKVVHSIKDYIDAWRHEQGIAYSPTETFEHYLRRVSQRILNRQRGIIVR